MLVSLKLITPVKQIERNILSSAMQHIKLRLSRLPTKISAHAKKLIQGALNSSPETASLISGQLKQEMGIVDASSELMQIFQAITQTVNVTVSYSKKGIRIRLMAVPLNLDSVVAGAGSYITEKGAAIPWFQWLTAAGDRIIVRDYELEPGHVEFSRTRSMIMKRGKKGWRVPPEFAGSPSNNFVTRAAESILPALGSYIEKTTKSML